jgi:hypothetical protein
MKQGLLTTWIQQRAPQEAAKKAPPQEPQEKPILRKEVDKKRRRDDHNKENQPSSTEPQFRDGEKATANARKRKRSSAVTSVQQEVHPNSPDDPYPTADLVVEDTESR